MDPNLAQMFKVGLLSGVGGWAIDNAYTGPHHTGYSWVMGGQETKIPFMPVYAVGGITLSQIVPFVQERSFFERFAIYGSSLGFVEWSACKLDRSLGRRSWDYSGSCTDIEHIVAFGLVAMLIEPAFTGRKIDVLKAMNLQVQTE